MIFLLLPAGILVLFAVGIAIYKLNVSGGDWSLFWLLASVFGICTAYAGVVIFTSYPVSSLSIEKAGQLGDSFGLLTSLFSGFAFVTAFALFRSQKKELEKLRDQFDRQEKKELTNLLLKEWTQSINELGWEGVLNSDIIIDIRSTVFPVLDRIITLENEIDKPMLIKVIKADIQNNARFQHALKNKRVQYLWHERKHIQSFFGL